MNFFGVPIQLERAQVFRSIIVSCCVASLIAYKLNALQTCGLNLLQNAVLPFLGAMYFMGNGSALDRARANSYGRKLGFIVGLITATSFFVFLDIGYYLTGAREARLAAYGLPQTPLTLAIVVRDNMGMIPYWLALVGTSTVAGIVGVRFNRHVAKPKR